MIKIYDGRNDFFQWDLDRKIVISDTTVTEVHFCNKTDSCSLVVEVYEQDGLRLANVPNILLQTSWPIRAYAYCGECFTKECAVFKVIARTKPADYVYTETEVKRWDKLAADIEKALSDIEGYTEAIENKLDKTTEANKLYGTNAKGEQTTFAVSSNADSSTIVRRRGNGQIPVPAQPADATCATSKGYVDTKVAQTTEGYKIYGTDGSKQILLDWGYNATANTIVRRLLDGNIALPLKPTEEKHAIPKGYVDGLVNPLEERVSELESLTLSYPEITSTDYEKIVPAEVGKYALVKRIGGATEKVVSKNILNPNDINLRYLNTEAKIPYTVDSEGWISFTINPDADDDVNAIIYFDNPDSLLYCLIEGNGFLPPAQNQVEFNCNWDAESGFPLVTQIKTRIMLWKDSDTEYPETREAPEGTVFEPYHEPYFINADVERVESIGANLIPFPYVYGTKVMNVGYKETIDGVTFEILENGLVSARGTATSKITFWLWRATMPAGAYYVGSKYPSGGILVLTFNDLKNGCGAVNSKAEHNGGLLGAYIQIASGSTINGIFEPIFTRDYYVSKFIPYTAEPIDTFAIPVEAIKAKTEVKDFGKGIDSTDYNYIECIDGKWRYVRKCREIVLTGNEQYITHYGYGSMNGISIQYVLDANYNRAKAICTDTDKTKESDITINSMWLGASNMNIYWVGVLDYLGLSTVEEFKTYLANRYANGNPVKILYKLATPQVTDITDLFTEDNAIEVEGGGVLRFVNEHEIPVPNTVGFITRKGG